MKKLFLVLMAIGLIMIGACGKSNDPKTVLNDFVGIFDNFSTDMGKAASADDVAAALNTTSAKMKEIVPRLKELEKKYPELKNMQSGGKMPEEFKEFEQKISELGPKMMAAMGNAMKYMSDPKVIEAQKNFQEAMKGM